VGITAGSYPWGITAGPDGNLWFAGYFDRIGRITPSGVVTEFSIGITADSGLTWITAGPDGNLWFNEATGNRIGRITTSGVVTEFSIGITADSNPAGITAGPDGNLWFGESNGNRIGRITTSGVVTEFSTGITANSQPAGITAGPDGNLWFTEGNYNGNGNRIGRASQITSSDNLARLMRGGNPVGTYSRLQDAYDAAAGGDIIQAQAMDFVELLTLSRNVSVVLKGGYASEFTTNLGGFTTTYSVTIGGSGQVTVENIIIK
jgi:streptogramin lyase